MEGGRGGGGKERGGRKERERKKGGQEGRMVGGDRRVLPSPRGPVRGEGCSGSCPLPLPPQAGL